MKILIADDHRLVIEAVKAKLSELEPGIEFVLVMSVDELLAGATDDLDLALIDLNMPGADGQAHIDEIRRRHPAVPVIVLSGYEDPAIMRAALERGVLGFIPKAYSPEVMLSAVRLVLAGGVYVPPMMLTALPPGIVAGVAPQPGADAARARCPGRLADARAPAQRADRTAGGGAATAVAGQAQQADRPQPRHQRGHGQDPPRGDLPRAQRAQPHRGGGRGAGAHRGAGLS